MNMFGRKSLAIILMTGILFSSLFHPVYAEAFMTGSSDEGIFIIDCDLPALAPESLPAYHASLQTWKDESVDVFEKFYLRESDNTPEVVMLDNGFAYLFDRDTLESMVFLCDPGASFRYMNGRAEMNYGNMLDGVYTYVTYTCSEIEKNNFLADDYYKEIPLLRKKMKDYGVCMGKPLQMTAYYNSEEDALPGSNAQPAFVEIAFARELNDIEMMPWGTSLNNQLYSSHSFVTVYIDADGISNVLVRLLFEEMLPEHTQQIMPADEASHYLEEYLSSLVIDEKPRFNYVALEYVPVPHDYAFSDIEILPSWNFYMDYEQDESRYAFSVNAFTGEIL